jgi:2-dehydro-3-deoxygalactonokinase
MCAYVITLDTGTTNTRVILWNSSRKIVATSQAKVGVRNTAIEGNNNRLKEAVKGCLESVLQEANLTYADVRIIIASGMITSNVGLVEIPHCVVPVSIAELAAAVKCISLPEVCPLPITFIPGVKNSADSINLNNFEAMDIMRGEEVEAVAIIEHFSSNKDYLLVLPGSHMKFISVDEAGRITGCLTSISGELLSSITNHTIISDAVGKRYVEGKDYDRKMLLIGYETAQKSGIGRACFSARILNQFAIKDKRKIANYLLGVALQSDLIAIKNSDALKVNRRTNVIVAGKDPLRQAIADILIKDGFFANVHIFESKDNLPLSAVGAYIIAGKSKLL